MIQIIVLLAAFPQPHAEGWYTLLQSSYQLGCSADYLISAGTSRGLLSGDIPFIAFGDIPELPWSEAHISDPLQSGIWGGGKWNTVVTSRSAQDSLTVSKIGLIQNTQDHSRYIFQVDRPLPWGSSGNFQILRDDSLSIYSALLNKSDFAMRTISWEGSDYGWGTWAGWSSNNLYARTGFARLSSGDRRPEILAGANGHLSSFGLDIGVAAADVDSVIKGRAVAGISTAIGGEETIASLYFEYNDSGEAFWGGVSRKLGSSLLSAGISRPAEEEMFQTLAFRHPSFNLVYRISDKNSLAADFHAAKGFFRGKSAACWNFDSDSLSLSSWILLGANWYNGRFEAGPRFSAGIDSTGNLQETTDILFGFTLATFSFATAVEDITSDMERSWSFGITWFFTDQPPVTPIEETGDRDGH